MNTAPVRNSWIALAITSSLYGADSSPGPAASPAPPEPARPPVSAGLLNDWLREKSAAFNPLDAGGQFRVRYESFEGATPSFPNRDFQASGVDNDNDYFWTRTKLHLGYHAEWFSVFVEGRHSTSSGDDDPVNPGSDAFDLHQGVFSFGDAKVFPLTAKLGRQEFLYGDERLIGAADWTNTGRVFDAARFRFEKADVWVDGFISQPVLVDDHNFNESDENDWFSGIYASSRTLVPLQESQFYFLARNAQAGASVSPRDIYSVGARVKSLPGKLKGWDYGAELVGQFGSINQAGVRLDHQAFASSIGGGYTWSQAFAAPRLGLEYSFSTGDSDPTDGTNETLDNLFPTNHKHYGYMDYVGWRNIHNPRLTLSGKPHKTLSASVDYHLYWLADTADFFYPQAGPGRNGNGYGRNPAYDSFVGSEINLDATWTPYPWFAVRAGYGHFFTGKYLDSSKAGVGGSADADWGYVQATLNF